MSEMHLSRVSGGGVDTHKNHSLQRKGKRQTESVLRDLLYSENVRL